MNSTIYFNSATTYCSTQLLRSKESTEFPSLTHCEGLNKAKKAYQPKHGKKKKKCAERITIPTTLNEDGYLSIYDGIRQEPLEVASLKDVNQPIWALPSWNVVAILLSYYDYADKVFKLLDTLSLDTQAYGLSHHHKILIAFLAPNPRWYRPDLPLLPHSIEIRDIERVDENYSKLDISRT